MQAFMIIEYFQDYKSRLHIEVGLAFLLILVTLFKNNGGNKSR